MLKSTSQGLSKNKRKKLKAAILPLAQVFLRDKETLITPEVLLQFILTRQIDPTDLLDNEDERNAFFESMICQLEEEQAPATRATSSLHNPENIPVVPEYFPSLEQFVSFLEPNIDSTEWDNQMVICAYRFFSRTNHENHYAFLGIYDQLYMPFLNDERATMHAHLNFKMNVLIEYGFLPEDLIFIKNLIILVTPETKTLSPGTARILRLNSDLSIPLKVTYWLRMMCEIILLNEANNRYSKNYELLCQFHKNYITDILDNFNPKIFSDFLIKNKVPFHPGNMSNLRFITCSEIETVNYLNLLIFHIYHTYNKKITGSIGTIATNAVMKRYHDKTVFSHCVLIKIDDIPYLGKLLCERICVGIAQGLDKLISLEEMNALFDLLHRAYQIVNHNFRERTYILNRHDLAFLQLLFNTDMDEYINLTKNSTQDALFNILYAYLHKATRKSALLGLLKGFALPTPVLQHLLKLLNPNDFEAVCSPAFFRNTKDNKSSIVSTQATYQGKATGEAFVKRLLLLNQAGIRLNEINYLFGSILHELILLKNIEDIILFIEFERYNCLEKHRIDVNLRNPHNNLTTLLHMVTLRDLPLIVMQSLLEINANPNLQDADGNTPLHHAILLNKLAEAKLLIQYGGSLTVTNNDGLTPLAKASPEMIEELNTFQGECRDYIKGIKLGQ